VLAQAGGVSMYRLVNVPVKPSGRFGAPETEPGPSGTGRPAETALMTISFRTWACLTIAYRAAASRP
jgi:hypothetical protein